MAEVCRIPHIHMLSCFRLVYGFKSRLTERLCASSEPSFLPSRPLPVMNGTVLCVFSLVCVLASSFRSTFVLCGPDNLPYSSLFRLPVNTSISPDSVSYRQLSAISATKEKCEGLSCPLSQIWHLGRAFVKLCDMACAFISVTGSMSLLWRFRITALSALR